MKLRNLTLPDRPAVFAPMAGLSDGACRHLMADHGAAWTVSEMASAKAITFGDKKSLTLLRDAHPHGLYAVQLFGAEPETLAAAIGIIREKGIAFDLLDLNMGCPAPKITSGGAGSKLLLDPALCGRMVAAARQALGQDIPLTVKMRIGWDEDHRTGVEVARQCEANGADLIAVHGRTREQMYVPPIDAGAIGEIRAAVSVPVLAGDPEPEPPTLNRRMAAMRAQIYEMCEEKGEWAAMPQARSQAMHYMKGLKGAASLRRYCSMLEHFPDVDRLIDAAYRLQQ